MIWFILSTVALIVTVIVATHWHRILDWAERLIEDSIDRDNLRWG